MSLTPATAGLTLIRPASGHHSWKEMLLAADDFVAEPSFFVAEEEHAYVLTMELAEAAGENLVVASNGLKLRLSGTSRVEFTDGASFDYVRERPLQVEFALPQDADGACAVLAQTPHLVTVTIPKHSCVDVTPSTAVPLVAAGTQLEAPQNSCEA